GASLLALLCFPFVIEPRMGGRQQSLLWSALFVAYVLLALGLAWLASGTRLRNKSDVTEVTSSPAPPKLRDKLQWLALAACGSVLLLSVTNKLLEDVAAVPLLWVLPLALYLLTFTLVFHRRTLYSRWLLTRMLAVTLGGLGYAIYDPIYTESLQV